MNFSNFIKTSGPGFLFASTAIGVSHLVQSTRAGAEFGLIMIIFVVAANLLKYPFFEFASRYSNSTQTSIIDGYKKLGRYALLLYFGITVSSMFFVTGAVGFVTSGFFSNLFGIEQQSDFSIIILFFICVTILIIGKYRILDNLIKVTAICLLVSTLLAFVLTINNGPVEIAPTFQAKELWNTSGIFFIIALMGWMPTAVDLSSWNSLWTLERIKQTKYIPKLKETLFEFRFGYILASILGIIFVVMGSYLFYGSNEILPNNNSLFAHKVVTMYTETIGQWSNFIISVSAFAVMFGTIIAVFDGYSRSLQKTIELISPKIKNYSINDNPKFYSFLIIVLSMGSLFVVFEFKNNLKELVDFATVLSFVIAPIIAIFNFKLVIGNNIEKKFQPSIFIKILALCGIIFLIGFALIFVILKSLNF